MIYFLQTETTFIVQGVHMEIPRLKLDAINLDHTMPLIWLSLADQIVIISMNEIFLFEFIKVSF